MDAGVIFTNIVAVTGFVGLAVAGTATAKYWQVCCLFHTTCFIRLYWITRHCWRRQAFQQRHTCMSMVDPRFGKSFPGLL